MSEIKSSVISKFGGVGVLADICGVTPGAVSQWKRIPAQHMTTILMAAREKHIDLEADDIMELPPKRNGHSKRKKRT